eukprot:1552640-Pleurochrysis_carterae.AAC.10
MPRPSLLTLSNSKARCDTIAAATRLEAPQPGSRKRASAAQGLNVYDEAEVVRKRISRLGLAFKEDLRGRSANEQARLLNQVLESRGAAVHVPCTTVTIAL